MAARTIRVLGRYPSIKWYLVAHMLYIDGLNTMFVFAPILAATSFGFDEAERVRFALFLYVVAGGGAILFGWLDDRVGPKRLILLSTVALATLGAGLLLSHGKTAFWVLGLAMGVFIGPVQSMSRSFMARLAPPYLNTQMFGLYALAGRLTAPVGPAVVSWITLGTESQRLGLVPVVILLAAGAAVLFVVREEGR